MGISGLLPALKAIQRQKHLSEFAGQTIGVDAYVWLHKGVFTCATEVATRKETVKYVKYGMDHIRLLRHYKIKPYVVFDGGPLPAKKGTEAKRQQQRAENLAKGNALAAQGRVSEAREFYLKSIDITPQMAFQFIKALKAEGIPYVVAPYEADAQLAYLERNGIVDAILTEDSDLLVFGCRTTLFKFDPVAATVISISRADFGSVSTSSVDPSPISLVGWSDKQFRAMAILSGCDYLPNIPGIGLKTAASLLRKWKTLDQVVKRVIFEGKKTVPKGYLQNAQLAELCFLHQRVFDPRTQRLVHLNEVDTSSWEDIFNTFVGVGFDDTLAKKIALGELDPITFLPMKDICPSFTLKGCSGKAATGNNEGEDSMKKPQSGILKFFAPVPASQSCVPPRSTTSVKPPHTAVPGKGCGKRTLVDVMQHDQQIKKKRHDTFLAQSRFFRDESSFITVQDGKENDTVTQVDVDVLEAPEEASCARQLQCFSPRAYSIDTQAVGNDDMDSLIVHAEGGSNTELEESNGVQQEDGYISPASGIRDCDDLSSPIVRRRRHTPADMSSDEDPAVDADVLSSPRWNEAECGPFMLAGSRFRTAGREPYPSPSPTSDQRQEQANHEIVDLQNAFDDDLATELASPCRLPRCSNSSSQTSLMGAPQKEESDEPYSEELEEQANAMRQLAVASGWRERWSLGSQSSIAPPHLRRSDTNVTPSGRHRRPLAPLQTLSKVSFMPNSKAPKQPAPKGSATFQGRKSLVFVDSVTCHTRALETEDKDIVVASSLARARMDKFKFFAS